MASGLLMPLRPHPVPFAIGSIFTAHTLLSQPTYSRFIRCDAPATKDFSSSSVLSDYQRNSKTPIVKDGKLNPRAIRQISAGSITGVLGGLAISMFSKSLAILIGLGILVVQGLESRGIHLVPYGRIQRLFGNINVKSSLQDNVAFKLAFGSTFLLATLAEF